MAVQSRTSLNYELNQSKGSRLLDEIFWFWPQCQSHSVATSGQLQLRWPTIFVHIMLR